MYDEYCRVLLPRDGNRAASIMRTPFRLILDSGYRTQQLQPCYTLLTGTKIIDAFVNAT